MKQISILRGLLFSCVVIALILLASCEKSTNIGGYFHEKISDKSIGGIEIGLYKMNDSLLPTDTWEKIELISTTVTDTSGHFLFEMSQKEEVIGSYIYIPIKSSDTLSINSKYYLISDNAGITSADWSDSRVFELYPAVYARIYITNAQLNDTIEIKYENQLCEKVLTELTMPFVFYMLPGMTHQILIYKYNNGVKEFLEQKSVYIKNVIDSDQSDRIFKDHSENLNVYITLNN